VTEVSEADNGIEEDEEVASDAGGVLDNADTHLNLNPADEVGLKCPIY
jgi:hypothetical protein